MIDRLANLSPAGRRALMTVLFGVILAAVAVAVVAGRGGDEPSVPAGFDDLPAGSPGGGARYALTLPDGIDVPTSAQAAPLVPQGGQAAVAEALLGEAGTKASSENVTTYRTNAALVSFAGGSERLAFSVQDRAAGAAGSPVDDAQRIEVGANAARTAGLDVQGAPQTQPVDAFLQMSWPWSFRDTPVIGGDTAAVVTGNGTLLALSGVRARPGELRTVALRPPAAVPADGFEDSGALPLEPGLPGSSCGGPLARPGPGAQVCEAKVTAVSLAYSIRDGAGGKRSWLVPVWRFELEGGQVLVADAVDPAEYGR